MNRVALLKIAAHLFRGLPVTTRLLREYYGCSPADAKRVLRLLQRGLPVEVETMARGQHVLRIRSQGAESRASSVPRPVRRTTWVPW